MSTPTRSPAPTTPIGQLATFGGMSVLTTLLDFGLFNALVLLAGLPAVAANTVSYSAGIAASYLLNKHVTFAGGGRDRRSHEVGLFVAFSLGGLALNNLAVGVVAEAMGGSPLLLNAAKLAAGVAIWLLKFGAFRRWVYPKPEDAGEQP